MSPLPSRFLETSSVYNCAFRDTEPSCVNLIAFPTIKIKLWIRKCKCYLFIKSNRIYFLPKFSMHCCKRPASPIKTFGTSAATSHVNSKFFCFALICHIERKNRNYFIQRIVVIVEIT